MSRLHLTRCRAVCSRFVPSRERRRGVVGSCAFIGGGGGPACRPALRSAQDDTTTGGAACWVVGWSTAGVIGALAGLLVESAEAAMIGGGDSRAVGSAGVAVPPWASAWTKSRHESNRAAGSFARALEITVQARQVAFVSPSFGGGGYSGARPITTAGLAVRERRRTGQQVKRGGRQGILIRTPVELLAHQLFRRCLGD